MHLGPLERYAHDLDRSHPNLRRAADGAMELLVLAALFIGLALVAAAFWLSVKVAGLRS